MKYLRPTMPATRRTVICTALAAGALALGVAPAFADDAAYPSKSITLVVPFSAGGSLDAAPCATDACGAGARAGAL